MEELITEEAPPTSTDKAAPTSTERATPTTTDDNVEALLMKLVEQNRKLEEDSRCTTQIHTSPTTSSTSSLHQAMCEPHDHSPSSHDHSPSSHDQLVDSVKGAKATPTSPTPQAVATPTHPSSPDVTTPTSRSSPGVATPTSQNFPGVATPTSQSSPDKPMSSDMPNPESASNHGNNLWSYSPSSLTPTPPSDAAQSPDTPSRELDSPTEVRSKPKNSAYATNALVSVSEGEESDEEEEEEEGLGPGVSIVLGDELDTHIPYDVVVPINKCERDPNHIASAASHVTDPSSHVTDPSSHVTDPSSHVTDPSSHVTDPSSHVTDPSSHVTDPSSHVTDPSSHVNDPSSHVIPQSADTANVPQSVDAGALESRDMVMELPSNSSTQNSKGRRLRSGTELQSTKGGILTPFKGRKRSHTIQESGAAKEKDEPEEKKVLTSEETLWQQWSDILKNWEDMYPKNAKVVKHLARRGIPEHLRGMAWQLLSLSINTELKEQYPTLIIEPSPHERAIRRDLNRTFPEHSFFKERDGVGQESLFNVLKAYSIHDKEVGYCQGSPFIVGLLLMQMPEEEAFCVLVQLMTKYKMREVYKPSMADLSLCFYQLERLIEELFPPLSMHFKAVGFQPSMYASPWFLTLFASVLSLNVVFRVMDMVLMEGRDVVFKVGLAILESSQHKLVQMDMEDLIKYFQKELKSAYQDDPDPLISCALKISLNSKKMKKFGKEYLDKKARKTLEVNEIARLHNENMELHQKQITLQQEFDSLREQLIGGQMTRAQQAEEIVLLRNDLAIARKKLTKLESHEETVQDQQNENVEAVPEWAETNGGTQEPHAVKVLNVSPHRTSRSNRSSSCGPQLEGAASQIEGMASQREGVAKPPLPPGSEAFANQTLFDIYKDSSASPQESPMIMRGLLDRGSKENFFQPEDDTTADTNSSPALEEKKKKKKKRLLSRSKSERAKTGKLIRGDSVRSCEQDHESVGTPPPMSPDSNKGKKEGKKKKEKHRPREMELEKELVVAKTMSADYATQLEVKILELQQALQREAFLIRELKQVRQLALELEMKISTASTLCPHCQSAKTPEVDGASGGGAGEDTGPNSTQALMTNLRAIWNSSPASARKN